MTTLLLLVIALIIYGSLYPWHFHAFEFTQSPIYVLLAGWPRQIDRWALRDLFVNVLLYMPLGFTAYRSPGKRTPVEARILLAVPLGLVLSTSIELAQCFVDGRTPSAFDIVCNTVGTAIGVALAMAIGPEVEEALAKRAQHWKAAPSAVALLALWVGVQWYPFFPALSQHALFEKLRALAHPHFAPVELARLGSEWLAAMVLVEALWPKRASEGAVALALLLPARFLIAAPGPSLTDIGAYVLALTAWVLMPRERATRCAWAGAMITGAIVIYGLYPFQFPGPPSHFSWIPLGASLEAEWASGAFTLLRKAFDYGAIVLLWRMAGRPAYLAAPGAAAILLAIEVAQRWQPGRTAEITDPFLALLMTLVLWLIDREYARTDPRKFR